MLILPAIDLRGGQCVRLRQGDYAQETVFGDDPGAMARRWVGQGARYLHIVDLDGAKAGRPINGGAIRAIVAAGVPCELGGGLRTEDDIAQALGWGVQRVVVAEMDPRAATPGRSASRRGIGTRSGPRTSPPSRPSRARSTGNRR